jgi:hypothetical protein
MFNLSAAAEIKSLTGQNPLLWIGVEWSMRLLDPEFLPQIVRTLLAHEGDPPTVEVIRSSVNSMDQLKALSEATSRALAHFQGKSDEEFDAELKKFYEEAEKARLASEVAIPEDPSKSLPVVN